MRLSFKPIALRASTVPCRRKIFSMYGRGMTTRDAQRQIEEVYSFEASPSLISACTEAVMDSMVFSDCSGPADSRQVPFLSFHSQS